MYRNKAVAFANYWTKRTYCLTLSDFFPRINQFCNFNVARKMLLFLNQKKTIEKIPKYENTNNRICIGAIVGSIMMVSRLFYPFSLVFTR